MRRQNFQFKIFQALDSDSVYPIIDLLSQKWFASMIYFWIENALQDYLPVKINNQKKEKNFVSFCEHILKVTHNNSFYS